MTLFEDIKYSLKRNPIKVVYQLLLYIPIMLTFLMCATLIATCVSLANLSLEDGEWAFKEIMNLTW